MVSEERPTSDEDAAENQWIAEHDAQRQYREQIALTLEGEGARQDSDTHTWDGYADAVMSEVVGPLVERLRRQQRNLDDVMHERDWKAEDCRRVREALLPLLDHLCEDESTLRAGYVAAEAAQHITDLDAERERLVERLRQAEADLTEARERADREHREALRAIGALEAERQRRREAVDEADRWKSVADEWRRQLIAVQDAPPERIAVFPENWSQQLGACESSGAAVDLVGSWLAVAPECKKTGETFNSAPENARNPEPAADTPPAEMRWGFARDVDMEPEPDGLDEEAEREYPEVGGAGVPYAPVTSPAEPLNTEPCSRCGYWRGHQVWCLAQTVAGQPPAEMSRDEVVQQWAATWDDVDRSGLPEQSADVLDTSIGGAADRAWFAAQRARIHGDPDGFDRTAAHSEAAAEHVGPAAQPTPQDTAPMFEVGDRIEWNPNGEWRPAVVIRTPHSQDDAVLIQDQHGPLLVQMRFCRRVPDGKEDNT